MELCQPHFGNLVFVGNLMTGCLSCFTEGNRVEELSFKTCSPLIS